jgi:hypothetical protein
LLSQNPEAFIVRVEEQVEVEACGQRRYTGKTLDELVMFRMTDVQNVDGPWNCGRARLVQGFR